MSPMNHRLLVPRKTPGLLDLVPGAAAAYSLRSLSRSYAGPVVTVRRSSDDAEEDFTAAEVADGTLAAFCGAGDGFVKQWWDQSGNGAHAVAAADANEPQIVDSGVVITEEGKPAIQFDGTNDSLATAEFASLSTPVCAFILFSEQDASTDYRYLFDGSQANNRFALYKNQDGTALDGKYSLYTTSSAGAAQRADASFGFTVGQQSLVFVSSIGGAASLYANGAQSGTGAATSDGSRLLTIGGRYTLEMFAKTKMQELLIYQSDVSSQRELIEGNIAWSYSQ